MLRATVCGSCGYMGVPTVKPGLWWQGNDATLWPPVLCHVAGCLTTDPSTQALISRRNDLLYGVALSTSTGRRLVVGDASSAPGASLTMWVRHGARHASLQHTGGVILEMVLLLHGVVPGVRSAPCCWQRYRLDSIHSFILYSGNHGKACSLVSWALWCLLYLHG
jgi:hypothetical protein